ncbi:unnamed protein product [Urochloa humidicola]
MERKRHGRPAAVLGKRQGAAQCSGNGGRRPDGGGLRGQLPRPIAVAVACQPVSSRAINPGERWLAQPAAELAALAATAAAALLVVATLRPQPAWRRWSSPSHPLPIPTAITWGCNKETDRQPLQAAVSAASVPQ